MNLSWSSIHSRGIIIILICCCLSFIVALWKTKPHAYLLSSYFDICKATPIYHRFFNSKLVTEQLDALLEHLVLNICTNLFWCRLQVEGDHELVWQWLEVSARSIHSLGQLVLLLLHHLAWWWYVLRSQALGHHSSRWSSALLEYLVGCPGVAGLEG